MTRMARRFSVTVTFDLTVDRRLIREGMSKDFAEQIVPLTSPERVAEHLAYNLLQGTEVTNIDGFALMRDDMAELNWRSVIVEAEEEMAPPKRKRRAVRRGKAGR